MLGTYSDNFSSLNKDLKTNIMPIYRSVIDAVSKLWFLIRIRYLDPPLDLIFENANVLHILYKYYTFSNAYYLGVLKYRS